jgi:hypothetical protein
MMGLLEAAHLELPGAERRPALCKVSVGGLDAQAAE